MLKNRRGVSEMVAVVLVLIIVTILGVLLYRTSLTTMNIQYEDFSGQINDQIKAASERFEIVNIYLVDQNNLQIYLYSYTPDNPVTATIDSIYVNSKNVTINRVHINLNDAVWTLTGSRELGKNQIVRFDVTPQAGDSFSLDKLDIVVVSKRGVDCVYP